MRKPKFNRYTDGKPNLVVLLQHGGLNDYPFTIKKYRVSYFDFFTIAKQHFAIYIVRGGRYYCDSGRFRQGYYFHKDKFEPCAHTINAAVIYDKGFYDTPSFRGGHDWTAVNNGRLKRILNDKYKTYQLFKQYSKLTYVVQSKTELRKQLTYLTTDLVVYKPISGYEGIGIVIGKREKILKAVKKFPGIIQDFIDTGGGIPGICGSYHDLRILIMDGRVVEVFVRIPKRGTLLANVAQGGTLKEIPKGKIPVRARTIVKKIDTRLKRYGHRIYSIDLGFENGTPYLFEINAQPGLPNKRCKLYYEAWHQELLRTLRGTLDQ